MKNYPKPTQKQSNVLTNARYNYKLWEKRIIYQILATIQKRIKEDQSTTLIGDRLVTFPIKNLTTNPSKTLIDIKKNLISLRQKSFEIIFEHQQPGEKWIESGFINYSTINETDIQIEISTLLMPHLVDVSRNFTRYSPYTAMILKSSFSQRFYELCSRYRDTGHYLVTVDELKNILRLDTKYKKYGPFKSFVLEIARKELKELYYTNDSDICFTYTEIKTGKKITSLNFSIKNKDKNKGEEENTPAENDLILFYIKSFWPKDFQEARRKNIFNTLSKNKGFTEFIKKADQISTRYKKPSAKLAGILTKAMREDYNIEL